jgi:hypothetical protein
LEICLSVFGGEIIQFGNWLIWKFACRPLAEKFDNLEMGKLFNLEIG